ncbi:MAG: twin-arginine translocase subunit TatC [Candidatus Thalassarchaeaceae archaeon]|nr:twin-arginine translocase subunit TatC [Candidatus Thalassarchaeaceae archaeon]
MDKRPKDLVPMAEFVGLVNYLKRRLTIFIGVFLIGIVLGYPLSENIIDWLLNADGYLPSGVTIIILQPMEVILLKLRISVQIGLILIFIAIISDLTWNGRNIINTARRNKSDNNNFKLSKLIIVLISIIGLGIIGGFYSHKILIPMLLEFLANDAANVGLSNTWQLQSWIGFIIGLFFGSIVSFQTPLVALLLLRNGVISRNSITENRGMIWFIAILSGAALSPPDPLSMFLVGGPIILLLEIALLVDKILRR